MNPPQQVLRDGKWWFPVSIKFWEQKFVVTRAEVYRALAALEERRVIRTATYYKDGALTCHIAIAPDREGSQMSGTWAKLQTLIGVQLLQPIAKTEAGRAGEFSTGVDRLSGLTDNLTRPRGSLSATHKPLQRALERKAPRAISGAERVFVSA